MRRSLITSMIAVSVLGFSACNNDPYGHHGLAPESAESSTTTDTAVMSADANVEGIALNDPSRKIIKTAAMRCRVTDVYQATSFAEHLVSGVGGQIADSKLVNETNSNTTLPYSSDSLRQVQSYTTTANLTLRIPVKSVDTVLAALAGQSVFMDSRELKLDDVTLQYLGNYLKNEKSPDNASGKAIKKARKTEELVAAGKYADEKNEQFIDRQVANMGIMDQVNYATLSIALYQPERIDQMIIPDISKLLRPTFGQQFAMALSDSWTGLKSFFIVCVQVWPLLLVIIAALYLLRKRRAKRLMPAQR